MKKRSKQIAGNNMKYYAISKPFFENDKAKRKELETKQSFMGNLVQYGNARLTFNFGAFGKCNNKPKRPE